MKVEVVILLSPSLITRMVSVHVKNTQPITSKTWSRELRSCVKVEVAVLDSLSLIILMVSVHVKQHLKKNEGCLLV